jgi:transcriptional regulator with XRE-family HTH domain
MYKGKPISQSKLAEFIEVTPRYYHSLEKGKHWPSPELIERIIKYYSIEYEELLGFHVSPRTKLIEMALTIKEADVLSAIRALDRFPKK